MKAYAFIAALLFATPALADPIDIATTPIASFGFTSAETFGPFVWRGGLSLSSPDDKFGGLSALVLTGDCSGLLAVSDAGRWFRASLVYEAGRLAGIAEAELAPMLDGKGKPPRAKAGADAEALAALGRGRYMVGFESRTRLGIYDIAKDGLQARYEPVRSPKDIAAGPENGELEALGVHDGNILAISESHLDGHGNLRGWAWKGKRNAAFSVKRFEDYQITDLAILPDGGVLILERSFGALPGMSIRRFPFAAIENGATVEPELLFSGHAPLYAIDNMEGIALCKRDGETRITLVSDNNFFPNLQRTLLLQFAYEP